MAKFEKGHPGGPGRPPRQTEAEYLNVTMAACPLDTWREIVQAAVECAKAGDGQARQWLGRYLCGDPGTKAPTPTAVLIGQMIGGDDTLQRAVGQLAHQMKWASLEADEAHTEARALLEGK